MLQSNTIRNQGNHLLIIAMLWGGLLLPSCSQNNGSDSSNVMVLAGLGLVAAGSGTASGTSTGTSTGTATFTLSSEAIVNGELLTAFKCEQKVNDVEASIPLAWSNVPSTAGSLAVTMHHYPNGDTSGTPNSYLLLWSIDPTVTQIAHGAANSGSWYMGSNKDGTAISYTSPCSQSTGTHEYTLTLHALSAVPSSLPTTSSLSVTYSVLTSAIATVTTIDTATLTFNDVTP